MHSSLESIGVIHRTQFCTLGLYLRLHLSVVGAGGAERVIKLWF